MSVELEREVRVLREHLEKAERDLAILGGTLAHAQEHCARVRTKSMVWEGMSQALRSTPGLHEAMTHAETLRRRDLGQHGTRAQISHDLASRGDQP